MPEVIDSVTNIFFINLSDSVMYIKFEDIIHWNYLVLSTSFETTRINVHVGKHSLNFEKN